MLRVERRLIYLRTILAKARVPDRRKPIQTTVAPIILALPSNFCPISYSLQRFDGRLARYKTSERYDASWAEPIESALPKGSWKCTA
jgi:hypothetical protein